MSFQFDLASTMPKFRRPELLTHPHIPGLMAGINPRSIMGKEWWDATRKEAYAANNGCCHACGTHSSRDPYHQWLEAHECYDYDFEEYVMRYRETVALCHSCHSFIHSGRMWSLYKVGTITKKKLVHILRSRMRILQKAGLKAFIFTYAIKYMLRGYPESRALHKAIERDKAVMPMGTILYMEFDGRRFTPSGGSGHPWKEIT